MTQRSHFHSNDTQGDFSFIAVSTADDFEPRQGLFAISKLIC